MSYPRDVEVVTMKDRLLAQLRKEFTFSSSDRRFIVVSLVGSVIFWSCCLVLLSIIVRINPDLHTVRVVNTTEKKILVKHIREKTEFVCPAGKSTNVGKEFRPGNRAFNGEKPIYEARFPDGSRVFPKSVRFISGFPSGDATCEVTF